MVKSDCITNGRGVAEMNEQKWYAMLNEMFAEKVKGPAVDCVDHITADETREKKRLVVEMLNKHKLTARSHMQAISELAKSIDRNVQFQK